MPGFGQSKQKLPEFPKGIFHYLDLQLILHQQAAHEECRSLKKKGANTASDTTRVRYIREALTNVPNKSHSKLLFTTSATVKIFSSHQKPQPP
jgi:hypothetical protein